MTNQKRKKKKTSFARNLELSNWYMHCCDTWCNNLCCFNSWFQCMASSWCSWCFTQAPPSLFSFNRVLITVLSVIYSSFLSGWVQDSCSWLKRFIRTAIFYRILPKIASYVINFDCGSLTRSSFSDESDPKQDWWGESYHIRKVGAHHFVSYIIRLDRGLLSCICVVWPQKLVSLDKVIPVLLQKHYITFIWNINV